MPLRFDDALQFRSLLFDEFKVLNYSLVLELIEGRTMEEHEPLRVCWFARTSAKNAIKDDPFVGDVLVEYVERVRSVVDDEGMLCLAYQAKGWDGVSEVVPGLEVSLGEWFVG